jgi:serine/arginine repetitive matrix protein 2
MMGIGLQMPMQMGFGSPNSVAWGGNMVPQPSPYMMPPPADPNFLAAHQHAMMYAKQAYQMAVARQAMAAAGDEWERSSSVGGYGGGSMVSTSSSPAMLSPQFGMMPMAQGYGWSGPSSVYLPNSSQSFYGGLVNSGGSDHGGVSGPKNWPSSKSSYGDSFGPSLDQLRRKNAQGISGHAKRDSVSTLRAPVMPAAQPQNGRGNPVRSGNGQRDSTYLPPMSPMPASQFQNGRGSPDGISRPRTGSQPASPSRSAFVRKAPPPSSWKTSN